MTDSVLLGEHVSSPYAHYSGLKPTRDSAIDLDDEPYSLNPSFHGSATATGPKEAVEDNKKPFRFLSLSAEMRVDIYKHLLPSDLVITFEARGRDQNNEIIWRVIAHSKGSTTRPQGLPSFFPNVQIGILSVCRQVSSEAQAILYGMNTFQFTVDGLAHQPVSLQSSEIFGALGRPNRLPLLRNLRNIEIVVNVSTNSYWVTKRHRARLEYFVSVLKEHADDENQKSLLKNLKIIFDARIKASSAFMTHRHQSNFTYRMEVPNKWQYMYSLESLASLRGIEAVEVVGLPRWYAQCLDLCIRGHGGDVKPLDYPLIEVRRAMPNSLRRKVQKIWQTTRKWYHPQLDWQEFAIRNGIKLPHENIIEVVDYSD